MNYSITDIRNFLAGDRVGFPNGRRRITFMRLNNFFIYSEYKCGLAGIDDIKDSVELINHAFNYQDEAKGDVRITTDKLLEKMRTSEFYVIKDRSQNIVGCVYIDKTETALHFGLLAVADKLRGKGLAGRIIYSIENYALSLHKTELELDYMNLSPWLKKYYEKYGFKETGEIEDIGWCQLIRMTKAL